MQTKPLNYILNEEPRIMVVDSSKVVRRLLEQMDANIDQVEDVTQFNSLAIRLGVEAGRLSYLAGRMPRREAGCQA